MWTFRQFTWIIGLLTPRITIDRYIQETTFITDVLDVNWRAFADFFERNIVVKDFWRRQLAD